MPVHDAAVMADDCQASQQLHIHTAVGAAAIEKQVQVEEKFTCRCFSERTRSAISESISAKGPSAWKSWPLETASAGRLSCQSPGNCSFAGGTAANLTESTFRGCNCSSAGSCTMPARSLGPRSYERSCLRARCGNGGALEAGDKALSRHHEDFTTKATLGLDATYVLGK